MKGTGVGTFPFFVSTALVASRVYFQYHAEAVRQTDTRMLAMTLHVHDIIP